MKLTHQERDEYFSDILMEHYRAFVAEKDAKEFWKITPASVEGWNPPTPTNKQLASSRPLQS
jgi:hypothetical protein